MAIGRYFAMIEEMTRICDDDIFKVSKDVSNLMKMVKYCSHQIGLPPEETFLLNGLMRGCCDLDGLMDDIKRNVSKLCDVMHLKYIDFEESEDTVNRIKNSKRQC